MTYKIMDHTADVLVRCEAGTWEGLLTSAAEALYAIALENPRTDATLPRTLRADAPGREELLIRWLQELLYLLDTQGYVAVEVEFEVLSENRLEARAKGYVCSGKDRAEEVKSATYHHLEIRRDAGRYRAEFVLDL